MADLEEIVTCLPIVQEVLQGFRGERAFRVAREALFAFPIVVSPVRREIFEEAVGLYRAARRAGLTVRSGVDCLIAACALGHGLTVAHHGRDFDARSEVSSLRARNVSRQLKGGCALTRPAASGPGGREGRRPSGSPRST